MCICTKSLASKVVPLDDPSLASYWSLDNKQEILDYRGEEWGVLSGKMKSVKGVLGNAIRLTGSGDVLDLGSVTNSCLAGDPHNCSTANGFTVALWMKLNSKNIGFMYLEVGNVHQGGPGFRIVVCDKWLTTFLCSKLVGNKKINLKNFGWA